MIFVGQIDKESKSEKMGGGGGRCGRPGDK